MNMLRPLDQTIGVENLTGAEESGAGYMGSRTTSRVSVIIPTYNHEHYVCQAVDSALRQTYPDAEVLVVDDGSTDGTQQRLAAYGDNIRYIYQPNKGLAAARNTGVRAAQGGHFLFLDADDMIPPEKLGAQMPVLEANPDSGLVYSAWQYISADGTRVLGESRPARQGHMFRELLRQRFSFPVASAVVRRTCFERIGLLDETLTAAEDTDLWLRIARAGYAFGYVDHPLFQYRVVQGSVSRHHAHQARNALALLDRFFSEPNLPAELAGLRSEAYGALHYEHAARFYHAGTLEAAREHLRQALTICPELGADEEWVLEWIAGYALGPDVEAPHRFIDDVFTNLPPEGAALRGLRRRAHGRHNAARAFSAYQGHEWRQVRRSVLQALLYDPALIGNRGLVRIALQSLGV